VPPINCGDSSGSDQERRLGRLPWKSLGISELRDGSGETLWYAVSSNFKENTRISRLNSDSMRIQSASAFVSTAGSITVRNEAGVVVFDGSAGTGVVAVIIAPGSSLLRQDGLQQDRSAANINNPTHYLDNVSPAIDVLVATPEDNATFVDNVLDGFFSGPVRNTNGQIVANDRIAVITLAEIAAAMEQRVIGEISHCLSDYAAQIENKGRLPWAAPMADSASGTYDDSSGTVFGRLPDDFTNTSADSGGPMLSNWTGTCLVNGSNPWFINNWREIVLYSLADGYKPVNPLVPGNCGTCITVNLATSARTNRAFAVLVAGRSLTGQSRATTAEKGTIANYLEGDNATPLDGSFQSLTATSTFNDRLRFFPE
jgi:hypothetical protein